MEYIVDDRALSAPAFLSLANHVWPGEYDAAKTQQALEKTINITAYERNQLIGCIRILSDGYYFGTITELLVLPSYQNKGIGSKLLDLAKAHTPTLLYFGAQPGAEGFYEKKRLPKRNAILYNPKRAALRKTARSITLE